MSNARRHVIRAEDGYALTAYRFGSHSVPRGVVLLPGAMGVKQTFYFAFAEYLSEQGFCAMTFDYRGMGESAPQTLRGFPATLNDWARLDYDAALRDARAWHADVPLLIVGHSLGGQLPGMVPSNALIDGLLTIAGGSGYWRENAAPLKRKVWFFWFFAVPVYTRLMGYFPGRRVRKVGDLPRGVINQWSRWCRNRDYLVGAEGPQVRAAYAALDFPILSMSFTDDELMSARNTESLHGFYSAAPRVMRRIAPAEIGAKRIGHFGFFRPQFRDTLWREAADWLGGSRRALTD